jgi:VIT1/CCC1 family predicted Fe2+/Mn2+ transporter
MRGNEIENIIKHSYRDEILAHELYKKLAVKEKDEKVKKVLDTLSKMELTHAEIWSKIANGRGIKLDPIKFKDKLKLKYFNFIRNILGLNLTIKILEQGENNDIEKYSDLLKSNLFTDDEKNMLNNVLIDELVHEELLGVMETKGKNLRDFVYGISDGLIEVLAAVSGLASVLLNPILVGIGGLIVGLAGTLSMSIGAFLSTKSEIEINKSQRQKIEIQKQINKNVIVDRLKDTLASLGVKPQKAKILAPQLLDVAEDIIVPKLTESPYKSAMITAISYVIGAIIPITPFILGFGGLLGLILSYLFTGISTLLVGSIIGLISEVNPIRKGIEMTLLAISAAIVTHLIGVLASSIVSII